ncbi:helix-turn-helix domain-containing protein [Mycolicibacterium flavescens]|uniref:Transcriptional regulator n=1 Tax=Mycolicibacterium flavescens TaxID=1776 RepID=A0A1E3RCY1_MYCFV|nr:helix-turn-helix domain-containing protein [Mycolicibacterium flavescens]MCV7278484.1 helix-turn-helix domain-containing protein [Mycolicibacterium flavescens]ODQ87738.1 transcriptional regulator [Mycolicibacterium flavescens]
MTRPVKPAKKPSAPGRRELILRLLRDSPRPRSIAEIAEEMDVHPNTVRFHLDGLVRAERVEQLISESTGPGRPPVLFRASHRMDPAGPTNYRLIAKILADHFVTTAGKPSEAAAELGRSWAPSLVEHRHGRAPTRSESLAALVELLDKLGFEPEPLPDRRVTQIRLRHCPFHELVEDHGTVMCALHLGLMQGALTGMRGPVTVDRLDPLVKPDLCVARVASASAPSEP